MRPNDHEPASKDDCPVIDRLSMDARCTEATRMLRDGEPVTKAQRAALVRDLQAFRDSHLIDKRPMSYAKLAERIGVSASVLSEWVNGGYRGDDDRVCRLVDSFLALEDAQAKGPKIRGFAPIRVVQIIMGVFNQALKRRSIAVITGEPGSGKTTFGRWYADRNDGAVLITASDADGDAKFVIDKLHAALCKTYARFARAKMRELIAYLEGHKNTVIIVDESQKLTPDALETLRGIHDQSDPSGERNVPIILFGDETFYKLVVRSRGGERTPISPQITSRMFPVVSIESHAVQTDNDGQAIPNSVYTREDIETIVRNQRLRVVRAEAVAWVVRLANLHRHGRLRLAARVLEIAMDLRSGAQVTVDDLLRALDLFLGPSECKLCVEEMEHVATTAVARTA